MERTLKVQNATNGSLAVREEVRKSTAGALTPNVIKSAPTLAERCHKARFLRQGVSLFSQFKAASCRSTMNFNTYSASRYIVESGDCGCRGVGRRYYGCLTGRVDNRIDGCDPSYRLTYLSREDKTGYLKLAHQTLEKRTIHATNSLDR